MLYSKKRIDKILNCICVSDKGKVDILLKMDAAQYTNLGNTSTKTEKELVKKNSRHIYRAIKSLDNSLGESFLSHQD